MNEPRKTELSRSQKRFVQSLLKYVTNCRMILDAGCGSGWLGEALKEYLSATVTAVDLKTPSVKCNVDNSAVMDVRLLGFSEAFDLIIAKDIIEHLSDPKIALEQFSKTLKTNGKIIINVPSPQAPYLWDDYTHVRPYTKASLAHLLADSGFEILFMKYLAAPTPGAALMRIKGILDSLADKGFRKGDLLAVGRKKIDRKTQS